MYSAQQRIDDNITTNTRCESLTIISSHKKQAPSTYHFATRKQITAPHSLEYYWIGEKVTNIIPYSSHTGERYFLTFTA